MKPLLIIIICLPFVLSGQSPETRRKHFNVEDGVAIEGYDPVSYFDGKPLEGSPQFTVTHQGITYRFAGARNASRFKSEPARYEPAYGGWCAYAMGESGDKVKIDPETFKIVEGTLYLFYNFWGNNTLKDWNKDERKLKDSGDRNWKKFVQ